MNYIVTPLGDKIVRKKYERQPRFKVRVNSVFREKLKSMYSPSFSGKPYNGAIFRFPLLDMYGNSVTEYKIDTNRVEQEGIKMKYIPLQLRFIELEVLE